MLPIQDPDNVYFEWDTFNTEHIRKHNILPFEIEEAFLEDKNKKILFDQEHSNKFEKRYIILGMTRSTQKFIKFVICIRKNKIRVITAHKATNDKKLLKLYNN